MHQFPQQSLVKSTKCWYQSASALKASAAALTHGQLGDDPAGAEYGVVALVDAQQQRHHGVEELLVDAVLRPAALALAHHR